MIGKRPAEEGAAALEAEELPAVEPRPAELRPVELRPAAPRPVASRPAAPKAAARGGGLVLDCTEPSLSPICDGWASAEHCGYVYEYWKDNGSGCLTVTPEGFEVEWSNVNNLLGRKGLRPGSRSTIVHYEADYNPNGNSYLSIYGRTTNPLVEYHIVDSWGSWRPPGGQRLGQLESDGGTYDIYRTTRVNQPSIEGTATFDQYWSVRPEKKEAGTITVGNHFDGWESHGLNLGSLYEASMNVEGYQSQGSATVRFSME